MREIKFRAWNMRLKEMEYIDDLYWFEENFCHHNGDNDFVLQQYTGLKDSQGKEIYEKDILQFDNGDKFFVDCEDWLELFVNWIGEPECEDQARDFYRIERAVILGNLFENSELNPVFENES